MTETRQSVRIFISSPGDVLTEREHARQVIDDLQRRYTGIRLDSVLWEDLALPATASFQESIDFLLERQPIDIAVFIVWSRLGTPLGAAVTRPDGTAYRSGTEREFELMLAAFERSSRQRPIILAYARDDDTAFRHRLAESPASELEKLIDQRKLAEAFIREQFHDAEGRNLRAYQSYREPTGFAQRLRAHLRQALDDLLGADVGPRWEDAPYRGLEVFDIPHATIFHGRDEETCNVLQRLRDQAHGGCAFVVIVGASGSGKSSLARAGVAASLARHAGDDEVAQWRLAMLVPSLSMEGLSMELTRTLFNAVPELCDATAFSSDIASGLDRDPELTVRLSLAPTLARASEHAEGCVRLLLVLDQLEELWTDRRITADDRDRFFAAIEALARSGHVHVLATLRSDFYSHAQALPVFLRLKGEHGHFDLLPPDAAALRRLIREPARLAGLHFERHDETGRSLDEVILHDAACDPSALPLIEYALAELDRQRDETRRQLTFAAYEAMGGVEGALGRRADAIVRALPADARAAFDDVLPLLVTLDVSVDQTAMRRRAVMADLLSTPARKVLTEALIDARFLTTDRQGDQAVASLAHESLLRSWDRVAGWVTTNRQHLRRRVRVEQCEQRWEYRRDASLLLPAGLPLEEGRQLLRDAPQLLVSSTAHYIRLSIERHERGERQSRFRRRAIVAVLSVLTVLATLGGAVAWVKRRDEANARQETAQYLGAFGSFINGLAKNRRLWDSTIGRDYEVVSLIRDASRDLDSKLEATQSSNPDVLIPTASLRLVLARFSDFTGELDEANAMRSSAEALLRRLPRGFQEQPEAAYALAFGSLDRAIARDEQGKMDEALAGYKAAANDFRKLATLGPEQQRFQFRVGLVSTMLDQCLAYRRMSRLESAEATAREAVEEAKSLAAKLPNDTDLASLLGASFNGLGLILRDRGKNLEATDAFVRAAQLFEDSLRPDGSAPSFQEGAALARSNLGRTLNYLGQHADARDALKDAAAQLLTLLEADRADRYYADALAESYAYLADVYFDLDADQASPELADAAEQFYRHAINLRTDLATGFKGLPAYHYKLALLLATCPIQELRDAGRALEAAERSIELTEQIGNYHLALGIALFWDGQWPASTAAFDTARKLRTESDQVESFYLAMIAWQDGRPVEARRLLADAARWMDENRPGDVPLRRARAEAETMILEKAEDRP